MLNVYICNIYQVWNDNNVGFSFSISNDVVGQITGCNQVKKNIKPRSSSFIRVVILW